MSPLTEKQQAIRATGIGASEVAAVLGIVPGAIDVWARKTGRSEPWAGNSLTEFGQRIERTIAEAWQERHPGVRIYTPGTLRHREHEWAVASPDRVVAPLGLGRPPREAWQELLEIKVVFFSSAEYGEEADAIPDRHMLQVQWQLEIAEVPRATLVALVNGDYREYPVVRDPELAGHMLEAAGRWWHDHVIADVPPPPDGSEVYGEYLRQRFPRERDPLLPASPEAIAAVEHLRASKALAKEAKTAAELAGQAVKAMIGDAAGIEGLCTWTRNASAGPDWKGLAESLKPTPEQFAAFARPGARVLRLAKEKKS